MSLAPSFVANYDGATIKSMERALKVLGFAGAEETAIGATIVKTRYEQILAEGKQDIVISTCCHSVNTLVQKYFPNLAGYLADVVSPMRAATLRQNEKGTSRRIYRLYRALYLQKSRGWKNIRARWIAC